MLCSAAKGIFKKLQFSSLLKEDSTGHLSTPITSPSTAYEALHDLASPNVSGLPLPLLSTHSLTEYKLSDYYVQVFGPGTFSLKHTLQQAEVRFIESPNLSPASKPLLICAF